MKEGAIIDILPLDDSFYQFGRNPEQGITLDHPSISRLHAVLAYD